MYTLVYIFDLYSKIPLPFNIFPFLSVFDIYPLNEANFSLLLNIT